MWIGNIQKKQKARTKFFFFKIGTNLSLASVQMSWIYFRNYSMDFSQLEAGRERM